MKIWDLVNQDLLQEMRDAAMIRSTPHPEYPLSILNYTNAAQFSNTWNDATRLCRGLIVTSDNDVVARPMRKFMNASQEPVPRLLEGVEPEVYTKADGSLGVVFAWDGKAHVATRGSFTSDQAQWATKWLNETYPDFHGEYLAPNPGVTPLVEIIYPQNRIVVDYGDRAECVYLTAVRNVDGSDLSWEDRHRYWPGATVELHHGIRGVLDEYVNCEAMVGQEGVVAVWRRPGQPSFRLKYKALEYIRLHAILTETSTKTIWRALRDGTDPMEIAAWVPDEFHSWMKGIVAGLTSAHIGIMDAANREFARLSHLVGDRKAFAAEAVESNHRALLFKMLDGKPLHEAIWRTLEPAYERPFCTVSEDAT